MKILITGAKGFVGKNLVAALDCIRTGKDKIHTINRLKRASDLQLVAYDRDSRPEELEAACKEADFVFHLAGVNRPEHTEEFMEGNLGFTSVLLDTLKKYHNTCPVMLASSVQAALSGRYGDSAYGRSKLAGEEICFDYARITGAKMLLYRFPNLFGKWCRPNYNSVIATFCNNIANHLPVQINDPSTELELIYIDDVIEELLLALNGEEHRCEFEGVDAIDQKNGRYCYVPDRYYVTLGRVAELLYKFQKQPQTLMLPEIAPDSFEKKLYSTYLSYLPEEKLAIHLKMNADNRGSFTEIFKTERCGQFSVNISKPGIRKGEHWHHTKCEFFIVVSGHGLIQERRIGMDDNGNPYPVIEFEVSGDKMEAVAVLPGYTHNIINLSDSQDLVTIMWANELFNSEHPDTFSEPV